MSLAPNTTLSEGEGRSSLGIGERRVGRTGTDERAGADGGSSAEGSSKGSSAEGKVRLKHANPSTLKGSLSHHRESPNTAPDLPRASSWQTIEPPPAAAAAPGVLDTALLDTALPAEHDDVAAVRQAALDTALGLMREMGFADEALNTDVLAACGYNAERAISLLLGDEQFDVRHG